MFPVVTLSGHAYLCADRVRRVDDFSASPAIIDTHNCELIVPTFQARSTVALTNGMEFYSNAPRQEIMTAIDNAKQHAHDVATQPCAVSDHILVDPMRIVAILPYIAQLCDYTEEHGYGIQHLCRNPLALVIMDDGNTCLAIEDTPTDLVNMLGTLRQG
jgi:hypothetical protein